MTSPRSAGDGGPSDSRNDLSGSSHDVVQAGSVTGDIHFHRTAPPPGASGPVPRQLPADVYAFVNRTDELAQLNAIVAGRDGDRLVVSVHVVAGTAGAGKTSLVLHWAHQVKDRFPDGQLFVNLRGYDPGEPVTAQQALHGFLPALGVAAADIPADLDNAAALYRSLLADRRVLVLLDNAATVSQVRPLLPGGGKSLVLVTSRSRLSGLAVRDGARRVTLGTLPEAEAVALLRAVTSGYRPEDDEAKLTDLANLCARLPLALRIAAERAAAHPHLRLDDLLADLRDESALWDALSTGSDEEAEAVRTVFAWSYRALPEPAARLFRLLGLHPGPEFGLHAAASLAELPGHRVRQLLDDLVGAHLLEQTAPDRYQFHDLLRAYATDQAQREESPEQRQAALRRALDWYLNTADGAAGLLKPAEDRLVLAVSTAGQPPQGFADYNAAADWAEREQGNYAYLVRAAVASGMDHLAWQLAQTLWNALSPSASVADWIPIGRLGLDAAERSVDPAARIGLLISLGTAYRAVNRLDLALDSLHQALDLCRDGDHRLDEAHTLNLTGLVHLQKRRLDLAATCFDQAGRIFREEGSPRWAASALANAGGTYLKAGRLPEAEQAVERALTAHRSLNNEQSVGNALWLTAAIRLAQGRVEESQQAIEEALDIALSLRNHRLEGFWLLTLGEVQCATGRYGDALTSYQRSAVLHRRLGNRSREALAWRGAGLTYVRMDRYAEAVDFHRCAVAVHTELDDAWELAVELDHLASALHPSDAAAARVHWAGALAHIAPYTDPRAVAVRERVQGRLAQPA